MAIDVYEQNGWFSDKMLLHNKCLSTEKCVSVQRLIVTYPLTITFIVMLRLYLLRMINVYVSWDQHVFIIEEPQKRF